MAKGTTAEFALDQFLTEHHVERNRVTLRDLPVGQLGARLVAGELDAIAPWEPHMFKAMRNLGDNAPAFAPEAVLRHTFNLFAKKPSIESAGRALRRLLYVIGRGAKFAHNPAAEAQPTIARRPLIRRTPRRNAD